MYSGRMSACPAYLGVVINNRLELDELFRYDLLILCPAEFNLTFKVTTKYRYCPSLRCDVIFKMSRLAGLIRSHTPLQVTTRSGQRSLFGFSSVVPGRPVIYKHITLVMLRYHFFDFDTIKIRY